MEKVFQKLIGFSYAALFSQGTKALFIGKAFFEGTCSDSIGVITSKQATYNSLEQQSSILVLKKAFFI